MRKKEITEKIKLKAIELGFSDCGITQSRNLLEEEIHYQIWLDKGCNADMNFLKNSKSKRLNPQNFVENSKSVISVLYNYFPKTTKQNSKYKISKYAISEDYHKIVSSKLNLLLNYINSEIQPVNGKIFTDSSPVLEKALAKRAGLGWIGKNSLLITKKGSFYFIGELFVDIELQYDKPLDYDYCGNCTKCIDACPTSAIYENHKIDANLCIAYHTIENKNQLPDFLKEKFNNWIYGCDICQDICPWNSKIEPNLEPIMQITKMKDDDFENLTEEEFDEIFSNSAIKRIKFNRLKRNIDFIRKQAE